MKHTRQNQVIPYVVHSIKPKTFNGKVSMLTSMGTNGVDQLVPIQHLSLITQPILGARSRSNKNKNRFFNEKDKWLSQTNNSQQNSTRDSPSSTLSSNRIDFSSNEKRSNITSQQESSDSGIDLSLSTNSSIQTTSYPIQSYVVVHRPLSALDEDSTTDHRDFNKNLLSEQNHSNHLRFPPIILGRNRSMEDMLTHSNVEHQQQNRSSSFSDDRQESVLQKEEKQKKRSSDGILLELKENLSSSKNSFNKLNQRNSNILTDRSMDDSTSKHYRQAIQNHQETNLSSDLNYLSTSTTVSRKPNVLTLKPLRKKSKSNPMSEPPLSSTSSRLQGYDQQQQINSSNQTTPRSRRQFVQPTTIKQKPSTINLLGQTNEESTSRSHHQHRINHDRQQIALSICPRPGVFQQILPFDASPSKVNNLLLRHQLHQPTIVHSNVINYPTSISPNQNHHSSNRQSKSTLPVLLNEETTNNSTIVDSKKTRQTLFYDKSQERDGKRSLRNRDEPSISPTNGTKSKDKDFLQSSAEQIVEQTNITRTSRIGLVRQEKDDLNEIHQRKRLENPVNLVQIRQQQESNNYSGNLQFHHRSKIHSNNDRLDSTTSLDSINKIAEQRNRNVLQNIFLKHKTNESQQETKNVQNVIRHQKTANLNERSNNRTIDLINHQNGSEMIGTTINENKTNKTYRSSRNLQKIQKGETSNNQKKFYKNVQIDEIRRSNPSQLIKQENDEFNELVLQRKSTDRDNSRSKGNIKFLTKTIDEKSSNNDFDRRCSIEEFQSRSPIDSSSINSKLTRSKLNKPSKIDAHLSTSSTSSSSHEDLQDRVSSTPRTYRLTEQNERDLPNLDQINSNNNFYSSTSNQISPSSSTKTLPFVSTTDEQQNFHSRTNDFRPKTPDFNIFTLSDREQTWTSSLDQRQKSSFNENRSKLPNSSLFFDVSPDLDDEEHDDGWSDDSFEIIYVDENYLSSKTKNSS